MKGSLPRSGLDIRVIFVMPVGAYAFFRGDNLGGAARAGATGIKFNDHGADPISQLTGDRYS